MNENIIPFGYYIIRTNHAKDLPSCCPPEYLSVAGCLCEAVIPDVDNIPLVSSNFEPETFAEKWKLSLDAANELFQFNRKHVAQISYARSNYISYETARKVKDTFFQERDEIALVGIGVLEPDILANPDLRQVSPLPEHGTLLGYDLYEFDYYISEGEERKLPAEGEERKKPDYVKIDIMGLGCTICCCDANGEIPARLGITLNRRGLYPNAADAIRAAALVNQEKLGEPCYYIPLALLQF
ncbi:MAG: hypothetical protein GX937_10435 [Lentisphaerae bacterium]|jgi:hypothetical protein|nr:hypothetical protein [Lentisphaerota bacterium]